MANREFIAILNAVQQDHEVVLHVIKALKKAIDGLLDLEEVEPWSLLERLRETNEYLAKNFAAQMAEEEKTLFPILEKHGPRGAEVVASLKTEHALISQVREEFGSCLQIAFELMDGPPRQVLRDLTVYGWHLWESLDQHAHREPQAVRQFLGQSLLVEAAPAKQ